MHFTYMDYGLVTIKTADLGYVYDCMPKSVSAG